MKTYNNLFVRLCSFENLEQAYELAKKRKYTSKAVQEFEKHWRLHLCILMNELKAKSYKPQPLKKFILRDPKTRVICVSNFRDRIVHHALVNILNQIFEPRFIHDSYASRKGKGTLLALNRFDNFIRKVSNNGKLVFNVKNANNVEGFVFKADIEHYFDTVDHEVLLGIIGKLISDKDILWLARAILDNYNSGTKGKGMPLGNWTSQFFANIYLNELDQFVKHNLKSKYYIRYVDDFVILHKNKTVLQDYEARIYSFLKTINLTLHPNKCKIIPLSQGITFLGFKVFYHYKTVRKRALRGN